MNNFILHEKEQNYPSLQSYPISKKGSISIDIILNFNNYKHETNKSNVHTIIQQSAILLKRIKTRNNFLIQCLLICLLFIHLNCFAKQKVTYVSKNMEYAFTILDFDILFDPDAQLSIDTIVKIPNSGFNFNTQLFNPTIHNVLWLKLDFVAGNNLEAKWIFELFNKQAEEIIVYARNKEMDYVAIDTIGSAIPFYQRNLYERLPAFEIPLNTGKNVIYLRYKSHNSLALNANIQPYRSYINFSNHYYFMIGGFYFILLVLTLYNFLFFISTHDKIYLYYILFVIASALDCLKVDHIGFAILWPDHPVINYYTEKYVRLFFIFAILNYASYFLSIKQYSPKLNKTIWFIFSIFVTTYIVLIEFLPDFKYGLWIIETIIMTMMLMVLYVAIARLKQNHKPTRIFIVGYVSILIGFVVTYMFYSGWVAGNHLVYYILFYAILIDTFMFSFALSSRLRHERLEKEKALEAKNLARQQQIDLMIQNEKLLNKVNAELEEKVRERTAEIEESKRQLTMQAEIIQQFNISLDKENWQLNKTIKSLQLKKMIPENVSYKQMQELFPSESDYYKFLSDYKWKKGFQCRKCRNKKESRTNDFYSRRCSKCGFIESITAHTLFHKLKFPLDKAFYIVYRIFTSRENIKITDLAQELDLNYRTCLHFKMKVEEAIETRKKQGFIINSWEDLISDI